LLADDPEPYDEEKHPSMAKQPAVSDATLTKALAAYAGMVRQVLDNPQRWLGADNEPPPEACLPARALDAVKDRTLGETTPASPQMGQAEPSARQPTKPKNSSL
jgi:hypothetical protein